MNWRKLDIYIAWLLLVILAGVVIHAPLTVWLTSNGAPDAVKAWKEVLLAVAGVLLAVDITRRKAWRQFTSDKLLLAIAAYSLLHIVIAPFTTGGMPSVLAGLLIDLRYVAYFAVVYCFLKLYPQYKPSFITMAVFGAVVVLGFALLQLVLPKDILTVLGYGKDTILPYITIDSNPDYVRINSTLRGPNPLGAYAVMALAAVVAFAVGCTLKDARLKWLHAGLAIGAIAALAMSHSRSAWIAAIVAVGLVLFIHYNGRISVKFAAIAGVVVAGALGGLFMARDTAFVHNVILHDDPELGPVETSNEGHLASLLHGTEKMLASPLGHGVGSTGSASLQGDNPLIIENQYLFIAHEAGWLGLVLFVGIFAMVMVRLWRARQDWLALAVFASGAGLAVIGILLPVWVDDTVSIVWWGLAAAVLATNGGKRGRTTNKKAA